MVGSYQLLSLLEPVTDKGDQAGKFVARVNVLFDDVKGEIVKPAKAPNHERQQHRGPPRREVEEKQDGGSDANEEKKQSL
jgi:hypothetical protein